MTYSDELFRELGRIAVAAGSIEFFAHEVLVLLISGEPEDSVGEALSANQPMSWQLDRIRKLAPLRLSPGLCKGISGWLGRVKDAAKLRNRLLHSAWTEPDDELRHIGGTMGHRRGSWVAREYTFEELARFSQQLLEVEEETLQVYEDVADELILDSIFDASDAGIDE